MVSVLDYVICPQCSYREADSEYNCRTGEEYTSCSRCGFGESWDAEYDDNGIFREFKHVVHQGVGVLFYQAQGSLGLCAQPLSSEESVLKAEQWLREGLRTNKIHRDTAYLTRWVVESHSVELVIGILRSWEDTSRLALGRFDLRPFQLTQTATQVAVTYSCAHTGKAWVLVLQNQPIPKDGAVFTAYMPCRECMQGASQPVVTKWENLALDGTDDVITPAFNHPHDLATAASLFYTAFPERQRKHPESIGFEFQLQGWSDDYIASGKWLCDCSGCRANPTQGCKRL
jgi:hypothetical protein